MGIIEIHISKLVKRKILSSLDENLKNIIEVLSKGNNIFSVLFLYELHKQHKFDGFQDYFKTLISERKDKNISLWNGDALFIYVSCLLYERTKNIYYINTAFELINNAKIDDKYCENSLLRGYAGLILSLLMLSGYTNHPELLEKINYLIYRLLNNMEYDEFGISWRETNDNPDIGIKPQHIKNLCGFGNGASGITYFFCCLSEIFNNKAFLKIVNQSLLRQEGLYDKKSVNWPDFNFKINSHLDHKKHIEAYKNDHKEWFAPSYENFSLEEGLIGIALANILMFQRTGDVKQKEVYYNALDKISVLLNEKHQFTTNRIAEIGLFLLSGYRILKEAKLLAILEKLLENIESDINEALKNQTSVYFYFIISCIYPTDNFIPEPIAPVTGSYTDMLIALVNDKDITKILLKRVFNRTIEFMELSNIDFYKNYECEGHLINSFVQSVEANKKNISDNKFKEIFELELQKYELQNRVQSRSYYFARGLELYENFNYLLNLSLEDFRNIELVINPECEIFESNYDWTRAIDWDSGIVKRGAVLNILENPPNKTYALLYYRNNGYVVEKPIKNYDVVLIPFQEPAKIEKAFTDVIHILKPQNKDQLDQVTKRIRESILLNFQEGVLMFN